VDKKPHNTPAEVDAKDGQVMVVGPGGISYVFTPDAADGTATRLMFGAAKATGQRIQEDARREPRR
jgi:hypothetical protein